MGNIVNHKRIFARKTLASYYFLIAVSFSLLLTVCVAWFTLNRETSSQGLSMISYSNNLSSQIRVFKNNSEIVNSNNMFLGLIPGDEFRFEITIQKQTNQAVLLEVGMQKIFSDQFTLENGEIHSASEMFMISINDTSLYLDECDANGNLVLSNNVLWDSNGEYNLTLSLKFINRYANIDSNLFEKKGFGFDGFYIKQINR